jgi:hypothetical protein
LDGITVEHSREEMTCNPTERRGGTSTQQRSIIGVALGAGFGSALGVALDNVTIGVAIGVGVGVVFAFARANR